MDWATIYRSTRFKVLRGSEYFDFTMETAPSSPPFNQGFVIITAWNPGNHTLSREENNTRNNQLHDILSQTSYEFDPAVGYLNEHFEASYCIYGMSFNEGIVLGNTFGQFTIFYGDNERIGFYGVVTMEPLLEIIRNTSLLHQIKKFKTNHLRRIMSVF
ncbi:MAG: DUF3293 domain-containing protein [Campylobacterales bacterium]|nr:DUF3293 domain-containing protein [Campylobacterales bacterium]